MKIGELSKQSGFSKDTLRYYEKIGLIKLTKAQRGPNNYRIYDGQILVALTHIRKLKQVGFTLNEIKELNRMGELNPISCSTIEPMVSQKLSKIEAQLAILQKQKEQLLILKNTCTGNCGATFKEL